MIFGCILMVRFGYDMIVRFSRDARENDVWHIRVNVRQKDGEENGGHSPPETFPDHSMTSAME